MEAKDDGVLALFDRYWFHSLILRRNRTLPPAIAAELETPPPITSPNNLLRRHRRSKSDEIVPSPALQIQIPKVQTVISGKVAAEDPFPIGPRAAGLSRDRLSRRNRDRRGPAGWPRMKGPSKSLSDLEFEELQGLMDLGFTFSGSEAGDPRLISIVPGLQRLRAAAEGGDSLPEESSEASDEVEEEAVPRPYLSEAWDAVEEAEEMERRNLLRNWRIPAASDGIDLKDHLRFWAHVVLPPSVDRRSLRLLCLPQVFL